MSARFKVLSYLVILTTFLPDVKPDDADTPSVSLPENEDGSDIEIGVRNNLYATYKQKGYTPKSKCTDPNFEEGRCLSLLECPTLLELAERPKSPNYKKLQYSYCGTFANSQHFCCSTKQAPTTQRPSTTTRIATTPRQSTRTTKQKEATASNCDSSPTTNYRGCGEVKKFTDKVVGGKIAEINSNPWIALIVRKGQNHCGGTLITNQHVVTAAHCFMDDQTPSPINEFIVRLAEHDTSTTADGKSTEISIARINYHEQYSQLTKANDIAIIKLKQGVCFSDRVRPVCLPTSKWNSLDLTRYKPYVAGWGLTEKLDASEILLQAQLSVLTTKDCKEKYNVFSKQQGDRINDKILCAGDASGKRDSCNGDSGGPLILVDDRTNRHYLIGIVSGGPSKCGTANVPGMYVRVSAYFDWINSHLN